VVLVGEGTAVAYLAGVMKALDAAGVRTDVVLGRGAGALVAAFSAFHAEERIYGSGGILDAVAATKPYRVLPRHRFAASCLLLSFAAFLSPALVGLVSMIALPVMALVRALLPEGAIPGPGPAVSFLLAAAETYYLPAVAFPLIALFAVMTARAIVVLPKGRGDSSWRLFFARDLALAPIVDLAPLFELLQTRLWQLVRGTSTDGAPPHRKKLGQAYVELLTAGIGQHGFREVVFYALDTDSGEEVPFVVLKDRFGKKLSERAGVGRSEPIDLVGERASIFFDALRAALSPPGVVPEVPILLPRESRFGGEVHRFCSSLLAGRNLLADAVAVGAEQVVYVTASAPGAGSPASLSERLARRALRERLEDDLDWAASQGELPVFVVRPDVERLTPFEVSGRVQLGGERLTPGALVAQGERDAERLFLRPVLGEDLPSVAAPEATVPVRSEGGGWGAGPKEM
jgi:hypothetical protein